MKKHKLSFFSTGCPASSKVNFYRDFFITSAILTRHNQTPMAIVYDKRIPVHISSPAVGYKILHENIHPKELL